MLREIEIKDLVRVLFERIPIREVKFLKYIFWESRSSSNIAKEFNLSSARVNDVKLKILRECWRVFNTLDGSLYKFRPVITKRSELWMIY